LPADGSAADWADGCGGQGSARDWRGAPAPKGPARSRREWSGAEPRKARSPAPGPGMRPASYGVQHRLYLTVPALRVWRALSALIRGGDGRIPPEMQTSIMPFRWYGRLGGGGCGGPGYLEQAFFDAALRFPAWTGNGFLVQEFYLQGGAIADVLIGACGYSAVIGPTPFTRRVWSQGLSAPICGKVRCGGTGFGLLHRAQTEKPGGVDGEPELTFFDKSLSGAYPPDGPAQMGGYSGAVP
jgi:hypothetical protein